MSEDPENSGQQGPGGPAKPPPQGAPAGLSPTRLRLLAKRGQLPPGVEAPPDVTPPRTTRPPQPGAIPDQEGPESAVQPAAPSNRAGAPNVPAVDPAQMPPAPPEPVPRPVADSTSAAATEGSDAGTLADRAERETAAPATASQGAAPARPAPPTRPAGAARPPGAAGARPAPAPAEPAEPEPDPEEVVALREFVPDLQWQRVHGYVEVKIPKASLVQAARSLRDEFGYDYLSAITAVDWLNRIEMVYQLYSFNYLRRPAGVVLRVDLERPEFPDYPLCPSLTTLWPGAQFQEREIYDLMGVKFAGHPDLRRILLSDDFPGHPLRKDFVFDYEYVLVRHLSYGVEGQFAAENRGPRSLY